MECPHCQAENKEGRRFCATCGGALPAACPQCGFANEAGDRFCGGCGTALTADSAVAPPRKDPPLLAAGERRQVTVMFADLTGYSTLSSRLDPEETHALLNRYFEVADRIVADHGGTIDKHIGDNVMAVFGAPVAHANDPERSVRAALAIHQAMAAISADIDEPFSAHIGIASGEVVASGTGSDAYREYTVTGDPVNLAARLLEFAKSGETVISDAVHRSVAAEVDCADLGKTSVKGLEVPVQAWRVAGLKAASAPTGGLFVDRKSEVRQFGQIAETCSDLAAGQLLLLRGEPGIGKTRLVDEFVALAAKRGFASHRTALLDFGAGQGRDGVGALVRSLMGIAAENDDAARDKAIDTAIRSGLVGADDRVFMFDLLNAPPPAALRGLYDAMDNATRSAGKQSAFTRLAAEASTRTPLLLIVEDVHWADAHTLGQLAALAKAVEARPVMLLLTTRSDSDPLDDAWRSGIGGVARTTVDVGLLPEQDARTLAEALAGADARLLSDCVARAEGNPLFLEQLLRAAAEGDDSLPASIQSLVLARVDQLPAAEKTTLQAASVLGQRFSADTVSHLLEAGPIEFGGLTKGALIRPDGDGYLFCHALIRQGVYGSLLRGRRRELHTRAADWFDGKDPVLRAQHLDLAGDGRAPRAFLDAAQTVARDYRFEQAQDLVSRGLELSADKRDTFALTCFQAELLQLLGKPSASIEAYEAALDLTEDEVDKCQAWIGIAAGDRLLGGTDRGGEVLGAAEAVARRHGLDAALSQIYYYLGSHSFAQGDIEACLEQHQKSYDHAKRAEDPNWEARALSGLGDATYARGSIRSATAYFERAVEIARANGFGQIEVANRHMLGVTRRYVNDFETGFEDVAAATTMAGKVGNHRTEVVAGIILGEFLLERCEVEAAADVLAAARSLSETLGNARLRSYVMNHQARVLLYQGRRDEARALLDEAIAIGRRTTIQYFGPRFLGSMALAAEDAGEREAALAEGREILSRGSIAHNHLWFYRDAMEACLQAGDWDRVGEYAEALEAFTAAEPLPWADLVLARARALAEHGRGRRDPEVMAALTRVRDEADRVGYRIALPALDAALADA